MREQPALREQVSFHDEWNEKYRSVGFDGIEAESKARAELVLQILSSLPVKDPLIVEVGCGTGWLTEQLLGFGPTTGIDLSPKAIEIAKRRGLDAEFIAGDFYECSLRRAHFDVAVCVETISAVPDQSRLVARLAEVVKPGGYLLLTTQNKFIYERRSDIRPPQPGNIRKWLNRRELRRLVRPHFEVLHVTTVLPKGDKGILRVVHSYKLNWLLNRFWTRERIARVQERLGLGHTLVVQARRRDS
jgi:2-polyprenyl-3-methyl-5-hydroxy-6-metoxy-1,4-benzoquinol methylase